jgi:hypothetical protein
MTALFGAALGALVGPLIARKSSLDTHGSISKDSASSRARLKNALSWPQNASVGGPFSNHYLS